MVFDSLFRTAFATMEKKILAKADEKREKSLKLLAELVKIPSPTGEESAAQEFVAAYLKHLGLQVETWEPDIKQLFDKFPNIAQYPSHWMHDLILPYTHLPTYEDLVCSGKMDVLNYQNRPNVVAVWKGGECKSA